MSFEIRVNGRKFDLWETATVQRSIDMNSGLFRFTSSNTVPADYPVRAGDEVQILINGVSRIKGFCDTVSAAMDEGVHTVSVGGRDNTADLIDSSVPDGAKTIAAPITMKSFCERIIRELGAYIPVVNDIGGAVTVSGETDEFGETTGISADSGRACMDFLTSFARKKQLYLVPDGAGRLLIYRPGNVRSTTALTHRRDNAENNVKNYTVTFDHAMRYRTYKATSQGNAGSFDSFLDDDVSISGTSEDAAIRVERYYEFQGEESMTAAECAKRATEEANIRRSRATDYKATVAGTTWADGTLWDFGQLVRVADDFAGVKGIFLIRAVEYSVDLDQGTRTVITCCPPEGYNVRMDKEGDNRRAQHGPNLQRGRPSERRSGVR